MSILDHRKTGLEALHTDLQRVAALAAAPGCTIDQVRQVLHSLGERRYNRSEMALCTYWQLVSEEEPGDSSYYGSYALNTLLKYSPLLQVLQARR